MSVSQLFVLKLKQGKLTDQRVAFHRITGLAALSPKVCNKSSICSAHLSSDISCRRLMSLCAKACPPQRLISLRTAVAWDVNVSEPKPNVDKLPMTLLQKPHLNS